MKKTSQGMEQRTGGRGTATDTTADTHGDWLLGNAGDDVLIAGSNIDVLFGGGGRDLLIAGAGDDIIYGEAGDDTLIGDDVIHIGNAGGAGNDVLSVKVVAANDTKERMAA